MFIVLVCKGLWNAPRNRIAVKIFIMIILAYSAKKNMANGPAAYSMFKPDTSSDSPSVRSTGARLVSARVEINHIIAKGHDGKIIHKCSCVVIWVERVKDPFIKRTDKRIIASVTSYEIVLLLIGLPLMCILSWKPIQIVKWSIQLGLK